MLSQDFSLVFLKNASSNCPCLIGDIVLNLSKLFSVFLLNTLYVAFIKATVATQHETPPVR